jgi:hypothetical protein
MSRTGRKPTGPALVQHLEGSGRAKQRLEVILATIAGQMTIDQACSRLGIKPAMFCRLRTEVLEAGLARLEPRPMGRPRHVPTPEELRCAELSHELERLRSELKISEVREDVARVMRRGTRDDSSGKKTTRGSQGRRRGGRCQPGRRKARQASRASQP